MLTSNNTSALKDKNLETAEDQMPNDSKGEGSLDSDKPILKESQSEQSEAESKPRNDKDERLLKPA